MDRLKCKLQYGLFREAVGRKPVKICLPFSIFPLVDLIDRLTETRTMFLQMPYSSNMNGPCGPQNSALGLKSR